MPTSSMYGGTGARRHGSEALSILDVQASLLLEESACDRKQARQPPEHQPLLSRQLRESTQDVFRVQYG